MPIPVSRLARSHRELVALLGFAQRLLGTPPIGDVQPVADAPSRAAPGVARHPAARPEPAHFSRRPHNAELELVAVGSTWRADGAHHVAVPIGVVAVKA